MEAPRTRSLPSAGGSASGQSGEICTKQLRQLDNVRNSSAATKRPSMQSLASAGSDYSNNSDEEGSEDLWEDALEMQRAPVHENKGAGRIVESRNRRMKKPFTSEQPHASFEGGDDRVDDMHVPSLPHDTSSHSRHQSVTLDSLDIESLIASYNPVIHPAVKKNILRRQQSILSARQDVSTQSPSSPLNYNGEDRARSHPTSIYSLGHASSTASLHNLPSATSNPLRQANKLSRKTSTSSFTSIFQKKPSSDQPPRAAGGRWVSGEMGADAEDQELPLRHQASSLQRARSTHSQYSARGQPEHDAPAASRSPYASLSMADVHIERPRVPRKAVSGRFTQSIPPLVEQSTVGKQQGEEYSPRSSVSSQSQGSFRWSVGSRSTASSADTSRTSSNQSHTYHEKRTSSGWPITDIYEDDLSIAVGIVTSEDEGAVFHPGHQRGKESIDSVESVAANDTIFAQDFPAPPPLSRKNSAASGLSVVYPSSSSNASSRTQLLGTEGVGLPTTTSKPLAALDKTDSSSLRSFSTGRSAGLSLPVHTTAPLRHTANTAGTGVTQRAILKAHGMGRSRSQQVQ